MGAILAEQVKQVWGEKVRVSDGASVTQVLNELQESSHTAPLSRQTFFTVLWSGGRGFGVPLWGWRSKGRRGKDEGKDEGKAPHTTLHHKHPVSIPRSLPARGGWNLPSQLVNMAVQLSDHQCG